MFTIKVQVIRNTAHRPSTQASYTIGSGTTMQENQQAAQIAAKHNIFSRMAPYMSWIFLVLVGIDPGVSHLGGEIVSHNTTDARFCNSWHYYDYYYYSTIGLKVYKMNVPQSSKPYFRAPQKFLSTSHILLIFCLGKLVAVGKLRQDSLRQDSSVLWLFVILLEEWHEC